MKFHIQLHALSVSNMCKHWLGGKGREGKKSENRGSRGRGKEIRKEEREGERKEVRWKGKLGGNGGREGGKKK